MPLHPQTAELVERMSASGRPQTWQLSPEEARENYRALVAGFGPVPDVAAVLDRTIPGPAGELPVRLYSPRGDGPYPLLVFFHGGGWVIGDLETHDRECRMLCNDAGVMVLAVDYRLAPEDPYPACYEDCWAALEWATVHAGEIDCDPLRIAVGGDSAGGNIAASIAISARDAGINLCFQLLVYPATDLRGHGPTWSGEHYPSILNNASGPFLSVQSLAYFSGHLLCGQHPDTAAEWQMSPLLADDHAGLAPAYVATCEFDPLRDEGNAYARKLQASGVRVTHHQWMGQAHLLFQLSPVLDEGKALLAECARQLRQAFADQAPG